MAAGAVTPGVLKVGGTAGQRAGLQACPAGGGREAATTVTLRHGDLSGPLPSTPHVQAGHLQAGFGGNPAPRAGSVEAAVAAEMGPLPGTAPGGPPAHGRRHAAAARRTSRAWTEFQKVGLAVSLPRKLLFVENTRRP